MKPILDVCCGSKMFYFDKENPLVHFNDIRELSGTLCDGRKLEIHPETNWDFRYLPVADNTYHMVVFDPPHLLKVGESSWLAKKYGKLPVDWKTYLKRGFDERMRVLKPQGTLIFKWNETDIKQAELFEALETKPVFGDRGRGNKTYWFVFMKEDQQ
ncbi:MAG: methyltransferase [Erysipelotrichaceae bacterium]|nr:methyltransferase [Erysipelotrichaceae bacterium]